jgi:hypothetical protein
MDQFFIINNILWTIVMTLDELMKLVGLCGLRAYPVTPCSVARQQFLIQHTMIELIEFQADSAENQQKIEAALKSLDGLLKDIDQASSGEYTRPSIEALKKAQSVRANEFLQDAIINNRLEIIKLLLSHGAQISEQDFNAALNIGLPVVTLLVDAGYRWNGQWLADVVSSSSDDAVIAFLLKKSNEHTVNEMAYHLGRKYHNNYFMNRVILGDIGAVESSFANVSQAEINDALRIANRLGRFEIAELLTPEATPTGGSNQESQESVQASFFMEIMNHSAVRAIAGLLIILGAAAIIMGTYGLAGAGFATTVTGLTSIAVGAIITAGIFATRNQSPKEEDGSRPEVSSLI